jgi:hypothetical protein
MQFPLTFEDALRLIPLAIGYAIILVLFRKSRRDVKRPRQLAPEPSTVTDPEKEEREIRRSLRQAEAEAAAAATAARAAAERSQLLSARAELLRTHRGSASSPRVATVTAAAERR